MTNLHGPRYVPSSISNLVAKIGLGIKQVHEAPKTGRVNSGHHRKAVRHAKSKVSHGKASHGKK